MPKKSSERIVVGPGPTTGPKPTGVVFSYFLEFSSTTHDVGLLWLVVACCNSIARSVSNIIRTNRANYESGCNSDGMR